MINIAVVIIVLTSLSLALAAYWFFGRNSDNRDGFETESDAADAADTPRTERMKDREFAEHLIRANVYTRIYEAYEAATGSKPSLDHVEAMVRAYRAGKTTLDSLEDYVRSTPDLSADSSSSADDPGRRNRTPDEGDEGDEGNEGDEGDEGNEGDEGDEGNDRTGNDPDGPDGADRGSEEDPDNDDRFDTKNDGDPTSGHDRFEDDAAGDDAEGENEEEEGEGSGISGNDGRYDDVLKANVRKLLKLAGVVVNEESVKRVLDRARRGLSSLSDLIQEEVSKAAA